MPASSERSAYVYVHLLHLQLLRRLIQIQNVHAYSVDICEYGESLSASSHAYALYVSRPKYEKKTLFSVDLCRNKNRIQYTVARTHE